MNPLPPAWIEEARGFLERQRWLGRLTTPSSLAASFAKLRPEFVEIRITIYTPVIDPKTGMVVQRETPYDYPLPAGE